MADDDLIAPDGRLIEPINKSRLKGLIAEIMKSGEVVMRHPHLLKALADDKKPGDELTMVDVENVLRCGHLEPGYPPERENGEWRYRYTTARLTVVVVFKSPTELRVVTAWRKKP